MNLTKTTNGKAGRSRPVLDPLRNWWAGAPGWQRWTVYILLIVGAIFLPSEAIGSFMAPPSASWQSMLSDQIAIYLLLALGRNVVVGMAGLLDLGYVAFYAVGGYTIAIFAVRYHWSFWETLVLAILFSALAGVILGAPTLRLRGDYLAIVTLGFGEIVKRTANNSSFVNGPRGVQGIPHPPTLSEFEIFGVQPLKYGLLDTRPYYYLLLLFIIIAIIFVRRLDASRVGRAWASIREDEDAAELMGVPTFRFKLAAFAIGAAIGGSGGVVFAAKQTSILLRRTSSSRVGADPGGGRAGRLGEHPGRDPGRVRGGVAARAVPVPGRVPHADLRRRARADDDLPSGGLWPSRRRKAELEEGGGGMGTMGAEVAGPGQSETAEVGK